MPGISGGGIVGASHLGIHARRVRASHFRPDRSSFDNLRTPCSRQTKKATHGSLAKSVALVGLVIGYVGAAVLGTWIIVMARYFSSP